MGLHNQFGVWLIGVSLLIPSLTQALTLAPAKIDSSQGEPLYAEIPFFHAQSQSPIQVSIAQPFEYGRPEAFGEAQFSHINFYVRQNEHGNGVIVITSSRPIQESNLDLMLKIKDGAQVRLQHMQSKLPSRIERLQKSLHATMLTPQIINNAQDIALNLPITKSNTNTSIEKPLAVQYATPPDLGQKQPFTVPRLNIDREEIQAVTQQLAPETHQPRASIPVVIVAEQTAASVTAKKSLEQLSSPSALSSDNTNHSSPNLTISISRRNAAGELLGSHTIGEPLPALPPIQAKAETLAAPKEASSSAETTVQHKVQANESLWSIAQSVATSQNISLQQAMQQIQNNNPHAFINGNANRLKQGAVLNINHAFQAKQKPTTTNPKANNITPPANHTATAQKDRQPIQTDAHMSIVANNKGNVQGSDKNSSGQKERHELTVQLKSQRENTLGLQNNIRQLDQKLKEKEQRLALINARLAELEQQLKQRQEQQKNPQKSSQTSSKSQDVKTTSIESPTASAATTSLLQELV